MKKSLLEAIVERTLLGDGAMGTQLAAAGLAPGECGELWNVACPEHVVAIQRRYVEGRVGLPAHEHVRRLAADARAA